jgi:hypothetical protein
VTTTTAPVIGEYNPDDLDFGDQVACHGHPDPDIWHADETSKDPWHREAKVEAKRICMTQCGVRAECLQYALVTRQRTGIWGGLGPRERTRELRRRGTL